MKKIVTTLCALAALAALAVPAFSATIITDSFSYPDGNLVQSGSPWAVYSGAPPTDIQVLSGRAVGNNSNAPDDQLGFAAQPTTAPTYACFNVIIPDPAGAPKIVYFALLKDNTTTNFFSRVYVMPLAGGGATFGLSYSSTNTTVGPVLWTAPITYGQQYNIVIKYDPVALSSTLWVNPSSELSASISQAGAGPAVQLTNFALRQSTSQATVPTGFTLGTVNYAYSVDDLGVGTSFADACGQPVPARTSTWGALKSTYR